MVREYDCHCGFYDRNGFRDDARIMASRMSREVNGTKE
jgi:hypothetical protein